MTKKDYIIIAKAINKTYKLFAVQPADLDVVNDLVSRLVWEMHRDNERFDEVRFREAIYK